jgi:5-methylthioadenosine/S-adenosylhomocysteine deaminase
VSAFSGSVVLPRVPTAVPRTITVGADGLVSGSAPAAASDRVIIPGLVNAHAHSGMGVLRGMGDGLRLEEWLRVVMAAESELTEADLHWSVSLALCEMIRGGTTAVADMYHWSEALIETVVEAGMRLAVAPAVFGPDIAAFAAAGGLPYAAQLEHIDALGRRYAAHPLVHVSYGVHAVYTAGEAVFAEVAERAESTGLGIHVHLSETRREVIEAIAARGETPIATAARTGLLGPTTLVAHATAATPDDIGLLSASGATVVHNPQSNLKLGSGIAPIAAMLAGGVNVAIGTDGPASNDSLDLLRDLRLAVGLQRGVAEAADVWSASDALALATVSGSRALGFSPTSLDAGDPADLVVLDASAARAQPLHSPGAFIAWVATAADVRDVVVAGRTLMRDGELLTLDEDRIRFEARRVADRLRPT